MKVLAISGSSGGHIFPALGFLDAISRKREGTDVLLVLPKKSITSRIGSLKYRLDYISISPVKLSLGLKNLGAILMFLKGSFQSIFILLRFRPDIVVGFGSLVCIPSILFARLFGIKTLIHEQNVIPGRANRLLARLADRIAISFAETGDYFKDDTRKVILTGNPIRRELNRIDKNKALDFFGLKNDKFTVLVMGGSQSSHRINSGVLKAVSVMQDKSRLQIIHLVGAQDYGLLENSYRGFNISFCLFDFLRPMQYAYSACDLVISRAGATTITEIMFFELAAILVPYPFAYRHQIANAKVLENIGSGIIVQDEELDSDILSRNISDLMNNPERLKAMRSHYYTLPRMDANNLLAETALSLS